MGICLYHVCGLLILYVCIDCILAASPCHSLFGGGNYAKKETGEVTVYKNTCVFVLQFFFFFFLAESSTMDTNQDNTFPMDICLLAVKKIVEIEPKY